MHVKLFALSWCEIEFANILSLIYLMSDDEVNFNPIMLIFSYGNPRLV